MTDINIDNLRDFALYGYKALQDVAYAAFNANDLDTLKTVLDEVASTFDRFLESPTDGSLEVLKLQIDATTSEDERRALQQEIDRQIKRANVASTLSLARDQMIFGLAARALDVLLARKEREPSFSLVKELIDHLPNTLYKLTTVFESASDHKTSDFWGWHWWNLTADGRVHEVDTFSAPNRLYCVRALQLLAATDIRPPAQVQFPKSENLISLFDEANPRSVPAMVVQLEKDETRLAGILTERELACSKELLAMLKAAKLEQEAAREARLAATQLAPEKLNEFQGNVLHAFWESGRIRPLLRICGIYHDQTKEPAPAGVLSWGYNQLDDKGAFITDWYVSYPSWGEAYGRGLAQSEDQIAFSQMLDAAEHYRDVLAHELIPALQSQIHSRKLREPIVLQTRRSRLEYGDARQKELFIPRYHRDCPRTAFSDLESFVGVFRFSDVVVPVLDIYVPNPDLSNKLLVADIKRFVRWVQLRPADTPDEEPYIVDGIFIRVTDLNADVQRRERLLQENPPWLHEHVDKDKFLRTRVVVNVYQKFKLEFPDRSAGIRITLREGIDG